jgi:YHS domain-containing protein
MRERNEAVESGAREGGVSVDPICGAPVAEGDGPSLEYRDRRYHFCSERCRARFAKQADRMRIAELAKMGGLFAARKVRWGVA